MGGILLLLLLPLWAAAGGTGEAEAEDAGVISGRVFTADHPDSIARGAVIHLVYRDSSGEIKHLATTTGDDGRFTCRGLALDPRISYVVEIEKGEHQFLGAPLHFDPGKRQLDFDVLVSRNAPKIDLPAATALQGRPVPVRPGPTLLITALICACFALPVLWLRHLDARRKAPSRRALFL